MMLNENSTAQRKGEVKCVQCHREMEEYGDVIPEACKRGDTWYCDHPECPNYKLLQVGE